MARMDSILEEASTDLLRRMPKNPVIGIGTAVGIVREFPESGLVPFSFVDGVMGIRPGLEGLRISPSLPEGWRGATVRDFWFAGARWTISADRSAKEPGVTRGDDGSLRLVVPADKTTILPPGGEPHSTP
jgi:hypothetical protein